MKKHNILLFLIIGFLANSCIEEVPLVVFDEGIRVSISGEITTELEPYTVTVKNSAKFVSGEEGTEAPISNAVVKILDDQGTVATLTETSVQGTYESNTGDIQGIIGRSYWVEVQFDGKTYRSTPETIVEAPPIDNLSFEYETENFLNDNGSIQTRDFVRVLVDTEFESNTPTYLKWDVSGEFELREWGSPTNLSADICYIKETIDLDNIRVLSNEEINGNILEQEPILIKTIDYRFAIKYCFHVRQKSLSKRSYDFWKVVQDEISRTGSIFETPPAKIRGNIENINDANEEVLGFFSASHFITKRLFVLGAEVDSPTPFCRPWPLPRPPECENCLLRPRSTTVKPFYW